MDSKSIVRFVRPWVQIPPTPPKARQPPSFPGFLFARFRILPIDQPKNLKGNIQYSIIRVEMTS